MFLMEEENSSWVNIKVVGVGGGGGNAINNMITHQVKGVNFIAANTDRQVLALSLASCTIQLGEKLTRGRGAGADPHVGRDAAIESTDEIREALSGSEMVFVAASLGGGTGTGAAPVIASIAKELGALTVGVVTRPFQFEGALKGRVAEEGLREMKKGCHSVIVIPNQRLLNVVEKGTSVHNAFVVVDDILRQAVAGVTDLIVLPGRINVDFADVRATMSYPGRAVMGVGISQGENRVMEAAQAAIGSPLLEDGSIEGAKGVLISFCGGNNLGIHDVAEASSMISGRMDPEARMIFGTTLIPEDSEAVKVTLIATGFQGEEKREEIGDIYAHRRGVAVDIEKRGGLRKIPRLVSKETYCEAEWDLPTFLRRQAD